MLNVFLELCFHIFLITDRVSRKGCLSDQTINNQEICSNPSNMLCTSCLNNDCNYGTVRRDENCITCNSAMDASCSQHPTYLLAEHCSAPSNGQCFQKIQAGATVRGCRGLLSETEADKCRNNTVSSQCSITSGTGSNNRVIPHNRLQCYHCDSRVDASCADEQKNQTLTLPCKKFLEPENCVKLELKVGGGKL